MKRFGEEVPLKQGDWSLVLRTPNGDDVPVEIAHELRNQLPSATQFRGREYVFQDHKQSEPLIRVSSELEQDEFGPYRQHALRTEFYPAISGHLRNAVLYESYFGKEFSDSPRRIFQELVGRFEGADHLVVVRDQQTQVPEPAIAIAMGSREYYRALAQARYVSSNTHLPACFERRTDQVVLQTWHGVGLKKVGLDIENVRFANKAYKDNLAQEVANWSYLISPNPYTSPILRRAFAFDGELLETGVPRNDIFYRDDRKDVAAKVRDRLGVEKDRKILFYAPTWRDDVYSGRGRYRLDLRLDLVKLAEKLGKDYAIVFRRHSNVVDYLPSNDGSVIDASAYPDVQDLLLVADILVTDYSTLMFDYANTDRPILFYTYDLEHYRDVLRGFYFDFERSAPGPLIREEADLVDAVTNAERIRLEYSEQYVTMKERFCPWDDGKASRRVVDAVFADILE
jgi:CDP-glycerol glycerophosphotransferase